MTLAIRLMRANDADATSALVLRAFNQYNAKDFTEGGKQQFMSYVGATQLRDRQHNRHMILVAEDDGVIAGVIEMRQYKHVSMLFVDPDHMGKDISRALWEQSLIFCKQARPGLEKITVNASTHAVPIYETFGFIRDSEGEKSEDGLTVVPMTYTLDADELSDVRATFLQALQDSDGEPFTPLLFEFRNLLSPIISGATFLNDTVKSANADADTPLPADTVQDISQIVLDYATRLQSMLDALQTYHDDTHHAQDIPKPELPDDNADTPPDA